MRIDDTRSDSVKSGTTRPAAAIEPLREARSVTDRKPASTDQVEISAGGRALAAQDAEKRLAELRRWLHSGGFDQLAVIETIARRLLADGEV